MQTIAGATNNYLSITPTSDYNAAGQLKHFAYGNGVAADFGYNDHLQLASIRYSKTGQSDLLNLAYAYGTQNNGQIASITDNLDPAKSLKYSYDAWGRLATAQAGSDVTPTWKLDWTMDRFGNNTNQHVGAGTVSSHSFAVDAATNRITGTGYTYDAAGNMTGDGLHTYAYDAENRTKTVDASAASYTYDCSGLRVKKVVGSTKTIYLFSGSKVIAEYSGTTSVLTLSKEYVYSGSKLLATVVGTAVTYAHADHLSTRVESSSAGVATRTFGHLPFGENWYETGVANKLKFTTYERDGESGLDYAIARQDSSRLGRFMSPDPLAGSIGDPQSLNRFAYSRNDPVNLSDPTGMDFALVCDIPGCGGGPGGGTFDAFLRESDRNWAAEGGQFGGRGETRDGFCEVRNANCFGRGGAWGAGDSKRADWRWIPSDCVVTSGGGSSPSTTCYPGYWVSDEEYRQAVGAYQDYMRKFDDSGYLFKGVFHGPDSAEIFGSAKSWGDISAVLAAGPLVPAVAETALDLLPIYYIGGELQTNEFLWEQIRDASLGRPGLPEAAIEAWKNYQECGKLVCK